MVLVEIRRGRSLDKRFELGQRIVDICTEVLGVSKGPYSSNSPSIPATKFCVTASGLTTGRPRKPLRDIAHSSTHGRAYPAQFVTADHETDVARSRPNGGASPLRRDTGNATVPRPRLHLIRFHDVLAPNAKLRSKIGSRSGRARPRDLKRGYSRAGRAGPARTCDLRAAPDPAIQDRNSYSTQLRLTGSARWRYFSAQKKGGLKSYLWLGAY